MQRYFILFCVFFVYLTAFADADDPVVLDVPDNMGFEVQAVADSMPVNWECKDVSCVSDSSVFRNGGYSARLSLSGTEEGYLHRMLFFRYVGETASFSGWFRGEEGSEAGISMELLDSSGNSIGYQEAYFSDYPDSSWEFISVSVPLSTFADSVEFGVLFSGPGTLWVDDLELLIDEKPLVECVIQDQYTAALDHEFESGSGIEFEELSPFQMESLEKLGKVWVFLKYHHPIVCSGSVNWDNELFRVLPSVLAASDAPAREAALMRLLPSFEPVPPRECSEYPVDSVRFRGDFSWIEGSEIGHSLAYLLQAVLAGRHQGESYYLREDFLPVFSEEEYSSMTFPDGGYRLLALYRFWGFVEYWFPYRYATNNPWSEQLALSLPDFVSAGNSTEYQLAVMRLLASVGDTHCGLLNEPDELSVYFGSFHVPVILSYVEDKWVITGFSHSTAIESPLRRGDVVVSVDGESLSLIAERLQPYMHGSTPGAVRETTGRYLLRGSSENADIIIERSGQQFELTLTRVAGESLDLSLGNGPAWGETPFSIMDSGFGFIDAASISTADVGMIEETFSSLPGIVIDMRGYPSDLVIYRLAEFLVPDSSVFSVITLADIENPGTFFVGETLYAGGGGANSYTGPVALLVDEGSVSSSEFHAMAWRNAPNCMIFGHATSGADGNVNRFTLPGGISTGFSGIGIYNPDGSETQRVGILPDSVAVPTVEGLQTGHDEVLEAAVSWLETR